ncbi:hypothetical protein AM593_08394, partial [Mytilus galloprovincialis]
MFCFEVCNQRKDSGPCGETDIRFFFNSRTEQCEEFTFGGCEGNANNFRTKEVCIKHCGPTLDHVRDPLHDTITKIKQHSVKNLLTEAVMEMGTIFKVLLTARLLVSNIS